VLNLSRALGAYQNASDTFSADVEWSASGQALLCNDALNKFREYHSRRHSIAVFTSGLPL
jgi:hypothetical protein